MTALHLGNALLTLGLNDLIVQVDIDVYTVSVISGDRMIPSSAVLGGFPQA